MLAANNNQGNGRGGGHGNGRGGGRGNGDSHGNGHLAVGTETITNRLYVALLAMLLAMGSMNQLIGLRWNRERTLQQFTEHFAVMGPQYHVELEVWQEVISDPVNGLTPNDYGRLYTTVNRFSRPRATPTPVEDLFPVAWRNAYRVLFSDLRQGTNHLATLMATRQAPNVARSVVNILHMLFPQHVFPWVSPIVNQPAALPQDNPVPQVAVPAVIAAAEDIDDAMENVEESSDESEEDFFRVILDNNNDSYNAARVNFRRNANNNRERGNPAAAAAEADPQQPNPPHGFGNHRRNANNNRVRGNPAAAAAEADPQQPNPPHGFGNHRRNANNNRVRGNPAAAAAEADPQQPNPPHGFGNHRRNANNNRVRGNPAANPQQPDPPHGISQLVRREMASIERVMSSLSTACQEANDRGLTALEEVKALRQEVEAARLAQEQEVEAARLAQEQVVEAARLAQEEDARTIESLLQQINRSIREQAALQHNHERLLGNFQMMGFGAGGHAEFLGNDDSDDNVDEDENEDDGATGNGSNDYDGEEEDGEDDDDDDGDSDDVKTTL